MRNAPNTQAGVDFVDERIDIYRGRIMARHETAHTVWRPPRAGNRRTHARGESDHRPIRRGEIRSGGFE